MTSIQIERFRNVTIECSTNHHHNKNNIYFTNERASEERLFVCAVRGLPQVWDLLEKFFKVIILRLQDQISTQFFIRSGIVEVLKGSGTPSLF